MLRELFCEYKYTRLFVALLSVLIVGCCEARMGVAAVQAQQANNYGVANKPVAEIEKQRGSEDRFTQTEALLQVKSVRDLMSGEDSARYIPYMNIMADCLAKEVELKDTHYAFYHTTDNVWRLPQDVYTQLYNFFTPPTAQAKDFTFLRFNDIPGPRAQDFLVQELQKNGLVDDNGEVRALLLSVNLSLFGNTDFPSECTWEYFLRERAHGAPDRGIYETIMNKWGLSHQYIDELMALIKLIDTKEKTLIQIFVPQNKIDDIGYLAWATGIPAHAETIDWVRKNVKNKVYKGKVDPETKEYYAGALWAMWDLADNFKKEQDSNPMFKDIMENVKAGNFSLDKYLKRYRNTPWDIPGINYAQARLIFSNSVLLNPESGVKFFRYSTAGRQQMKEYTKSLKQIIDKIIASRKGV